jgi:hypothetical protein
MVVAFIFGLVEARVRTSDELQKISGAKVSEIRAARMEFRLV